MTASPSRQLLSPEEIAVRAGEQLSFLHLPEPGVFAERALRLRALAEGHAMRDFLLFMAELADAQHRALSAGVNLPLPTPDDIEAAA
ncbi:formate dehydrogenase accessory protein FdhE, partial [Roseateles sp.]|uniref:formate dehydrogenase accessory protein FdhE domain-containing protein n=1 Tax=Roseateles sp. TaxID=1971397 RepID=UPI002DF94730